MTEDDEEDYSDGESDADDDMGSDDNNNLEKSNNSSESEEILDSKEKNRVRLEEVEAQLEENRKEKEEMKEKENRAKDVLIHAKLRIQTLEGEKKALQEQVDSFTANEKVIRTLHVKKKRKAVIYDLD